MNRLSFSFVCLALVILISCKDRTSSKVTNSKEPKLTDSDSLLTTVTPLELTNDETISQELEVDIVEPEFIYTPFSPGIVMKRLGLSEVLRDRSVKTLLSATLRKKDTLRPMVIETGDGAFDIYMLSIDSEEAVEFYYENDVITSIQVISPAGGPADMIGPGLAFENLRKSYVNPVAYGSEIEARVFVPLDSVYIRLATNYGVYEPIDVEDDTEIMLISF
ncbi:hypothetical protein [Nonlabens antarcticus]|uniref:hypothetical protein n=1 Tax=Nonlabens antarcticus TaxID=392714 RepID=UPI001890CC30|nr:hypothetical protein [Nonlabens antarcticus]